MRYQRQSRQSIDMVQTIHNAYNSAPGGREGVKPRIQELYGVRSVRFREYDVRKGIPQTDADGSYKSIATESLVRKAPVFRNEAVVAETHVWTVGQVHREGGGLSTARLPLD